MLKGGSGLPATSCQRSARASFTEFVRSFAGEGAASYQRGYNVTLLGRVQVDELMTGVAKYSSYGCGIN
jgi:hypothetical protein